MVCVFQFEQKKKPDFGPIELAPSQTLTHLNEMANPLTFEPLLIFAP
jgi:hypothetical protein